MSRRPFSLPNPFGRRGRGGTPTGNGRTRPWGSRSGVGRGLTAGRRSPSGTTPGRNRGGIGDHNTNRGRNSNSGGQTRQSRQWPWSRGRNTSRPNGGRPSRQRPWRRQPTGAPRQPPSRVNDPRSRSRSRLRWPRPWAAFQRRQRARSNASNTMPNRPTGNDNNTTRPRTRNRWWRFRGNRRRAVGAEATNINSSRHRRRQRFSFRNWRRFRVSHPFGMETGTQQEPTLRYTAERMDNPDGGQDVPASRAALLSAPPSQDNQESTHDRRCPECGYEKLINLEPHTPLCLFCYSASRSANPSNTQGERSTNDEAHVQPVTNQEEPIIMSDQVSHFESPRPASAPVTGKPEASAHLTSAHGATLSMLKHLLLANRARRLAQHYAGNEDPYLRNLANVWAANAAQADAVVRDRAALNSAHTGAASEALNRG
jgi:hypothetical protein